MRYIAPECPKCKLPLSLVDYDERGNQLPHSEWSHICDGPNDSTKEKGCGYLTERFGEWTDNV